MTELSTRPAVPADVKALLRLEEAAFIMDRLSRRSFLRWIENQHSLLLLAERDGELVGYGLVWWLRGTRLARLYSIAVSPKARGGSVAQQLLTELEQQTATAGWLFMRLEVAKNNRSAIALYERCGYRTFGEYEDYYEDHSDALRMQKAIRQPEHNATPRATPWYEQTTEFTCGPAALMMAMASLRPNQAMNQQTELDLWREATTIFMTSGHGGCHPVGLALAAQRRGFEAQVCISSLKAPFLEGVRAAHKKAIMTTVHDGFLHQAQQQKLPVLERQINQAQLRRWLREGWAVLLLISSYSFDGRKAPHWVTVTGMDESCLYVHEPDPDEHQQPMDCQHLPVALEDFERLSVFGSSRLRTAIAIKTAKQENPR